MKRARLLSKINSLLLAIPKFKNMEEAREILEKELLSMIDILNEKQN